MRRGELVRMDQADGWTIYELETDSLHVLNDSARAIWELCDGETTPEEMASAIADLAGLEADEAIYDVTTTLDRLQKNGLVVF